MVQTWVIFRYGPVWISTTLVFMLAALGNCATYLMLKHSDKSTAWSFDVSYINWAACAVYGYVLVVPAAFYFLLQYLGLNASLTRLWCMWGYSLFIFIISSVSTPAYAFHFVSKRLYGPDSRSNASWCVVSWSLIPRNWTHGLVISDISIMCNSLGRLCTWSYLCSILKHPSHSGITGLV